VKLLACHNVSVPVHKLLVVTLETKVRGRYQIERHYEDANSDKNLPFPLKHEVWNKKNARYFDRYRQCHRSCGYYLALLPKHQV